MDRVLSPNCLYTRYLLTHRPGPRSRYRYCGVRSQTSRLFQDKGPRLFVKLRGLYHLHPRFSTSVHPVLPPLGYTLLLTSSVFHPRTSSRTRPLVRRKVRRTSGTSETTPIRLPPLFSVTSHSSPQSPL